MTKIILLILFCALLQSCSLLKKSEAHEKIYSELQTSGMQISLKDLKTKVDETLKISNDFSTNGKLIVLNSSGIRMDEKQEKIKEALNDGFTFKNKLYETTQDIGWDLLKADIKGIQDKLFSAKYHLIEDTKSSFIFVKDDRVFVGQSIDEKKSQLHIYQIYKVIQPVSINLDWIKLIRRKGNILSFSQNPVDFEQSYKYKTQDRVSELDFYFRIMPEQANKREEELLGPSSN